MEGTREKGFSHIYRNSTNLTQLEVTPVPGVYSLKQLLLEFFLNKYANKKFLGTFASIKERSSWRLPKRTDRWLRKELWEIL